MYVHKRNIECNHRGSGKAISITYSECEFVVLGNQHAMYTRYIVICGLSGCTIFFHIIYGTSFGKKKLLNMKCIFWSFSAALSETFPIQIRILRDVS